MSKIIKPSLLVLKLFGQLFNFSRNIDRKKPAEKNSAVATHFPVWHDSFEIATRLENVGDCGNALILLGIHFKRTFYWFDKNIIRVAVFP